MQNIYAGIICLLDMNSDLGTFIMMEEWKKRKTKEGGAQPSQKIKEDFS